MTAEVVEHDDISRLESGHEALLDPSDKGVRVDRAIENTRRYDLVLTQRSDERQCLPVSMRNLGDERRAAHEPTTKTGHVRLDPGLIQKDQTVGRDPMLMGLPAIPDARHLRAVLLARHQSFF